MKDRYDAKASVVSLYPELCCEAVDLFLAICGVDRDAFELEECVTVEYYLYPAPSIVAACAKLQGLADLISNKEAV